MDTPTVNSQPGTLVRTEQFVGAPIKPEEGAFALADMAAGEPGLPLVFTWDKQRYEILEVLEKWKDHGDCRHGSGERYLRKHWYRVRTTGGLEMKLYFERQGRGGKQRWWLNTVRNFGKSAPAERPGSPRASPVR